MSLSHRESADWSPASVVDKAASECEPLLRLRNLSVCFGGIQALDGVSFDVRAREIVGLIGPNGAGKTTLFNCISGFYRPDAGDVLLNGRSIVAEPRHAVAAMGLIRTFQSVALFGQLTVLDNVKVGCHGRFSAGFFAGALRLARSRRDERTMTERAEALVEMFNLTPYATRPAGALPLAIRKRVELARALAAQPTLLLLDEPAAGLNHEEVEDLKGLIRHMRDARDITVLLVEHHMGLVMSVSDRVMALDFGRKIAEGTPQQVRSHPDVLRAYLGAGAA